MRVCGHAMQVCGHTLNRKVSLMLLTCTVVCAARVTNYWTALSAVQCALVLWRPEEGEKWAVMVYRVTVVC